MIERLRRPNALVEQTRWLFGGSALLSLALTVPVLLPNGRPGQQLAGLAAAAVLCGSWLHRYLARDCPAVLDVLDAVAVLVFALACPSPLPAFGFMVSGAWFRATYGSARRALAHTLGGAAAVVLAIPLWPLVPGHTAGTPVAPVLGVLPILLLTLGVSRHLITGMFTREQAQRRDDALAALSSQLLGSTDRDTIRQRAWEGVLAVCRATPGLHALTVIGSGDQLKVLRWTPGLARPADRLPYDCLPSAAAGPDDARPPRDSTPLPACDAAGRPLSWLCLALPRQPGNWLLLGAAGEPAPEALVAMRSLLNQVALALRNSDAHHDLTTQALSDGLTGLANRAAFYNALVQGLAGRDSLAVLFLDLDDFKVVNDGLGHAAGDELLRHVAARLREGVRPGDLCARLGGDEFAVLLSDVAEGEAVRVTERLIELLSAPVTLGGGLATVGASIGLALAEPGLTPDQLVQRADVAMYAAKAQGKNQAQTFSPRLLQPVANASGRPVSPLA